MAAKTFTLSGNGTSASQALDAASLAMIIYGDAGGGNVTIEASKDNTNFAPVFESVSLLNPTLKINRANNFTMPGGWYVRLKLANATTVPSLTLVIE